ncbi:replication protein, partial [Xenorhabdus sp. 18]|nr:replication protein [Xenorhabdus sp. 18]
QILLSYYEENEPLNSIEILRGKQKSIPEQKASKNKPEKLEMKNND